MTQANKFLNPQFETDDALLDEIQNRGSLIPDVDEPSEKREVSKSEKIAGEIVDFIMPDPELAVDIYRTGYNIATGVPRVVADTFFPAIERFAPEKYANNIANFGNQTQDLALRAYIKNAMPLGLPPLGNLTGSEHKAKEIIFDYKKNRPKHAESLAGVFLAEIPATIATGKIAFDGLTRIAPKLKKLPKFLLAEQIAEQIVMDPSYNLGNLIKDAGGFFLDPEDPEDAGKLVQIATDNPVINSLATSNEDPIDLQRAKTALVSGFSFFGMAVLTFQPLIL